MAFIPKRVSFPRTRGREVQAFVRAYKAKYGIEPDNFSAFAYDSAVLVGAVMNQYGTDRESVQDGLGKIKDVPSVVFGRASFDFQTRRVRGVHHVRLVVRSGAFTLWDGKPATSGKP